MANSIGATSAVNSVNSLNLPEIDNPELEKMLSDIQALKAAIAKLIQDVQTEGQGNWPGTAGGMEQTYGQDVDAILQAAQQLSTDMGSPSDAPGTNTFFGQMNGGGAVGFEDKQFAQRYNVLGLFDELNGGPSPTKGGIFGPQGDMSMADYLVEMGAGQLGSLAALLGKFPPS